MKYLGIYFINKHAISENIFTRCETVQTRIVALNYSAKRSVTNGLKYPASMAMGTESFWICICNSIFYRFTYIVNYLKYLSTNDSMTNMPGRNIWINFEAPQQCIRHIIPWKKCSNFMQFLKYLAEPFLRPLRLRRWSKYLFETCVQLSQSINFYKVGKFRIMSYSEIVVSGQNPSVICQKIDMFEQINDQRLVGSK